MIHVSQAPTSTLPRCFLKFSHLEVKSGFVRDSEKVDKQESPTWWFKPWPFWDGEFTWPFWKGLFVTSNDRGWSLGTAWITWNMFFLSTEVATNDSPRKNMFQVIQSAWPFYPLVGGHQQPFQKGHVNSPSPKRSRIESPGKDVLKLLVKSLESSNKHCKQPMDLKFRWCFA